MNILLRMENLTFAQIELIVQKEKRARELAAARMKKWKDNHPEEHREKSKKYMAAYNARKRAEKAALKASTAAESNIASSDEIQS